MNKSIEKARMAKHGDIQMAAILHGPLVLDLGNGWRHKLDPGNQGESERWYATAMDDSWKPVDLDRCAMAHRNRMYKDTAWYALDFLLPRTESGSRLWLVFYSTAGRATIWLNGNPVGEHATWPIGSWNKSWALEISGHVKAVGGNRLVLRCDLIKRPAQIPALGSLTQKAGLYSPVEIRGELDETKTKNLSVAELTPRICMNTVGFLASGPKYFVVLNALDDDDEFEVCAGWRSVYRGKLRKVSGDFCAGMVGEFSELTTVGSYRIVCKNAESTYFFIGDNCLNYPLRTLFNYFPTKRCGDTVKGYMEQPCHTQMFRNDNGEPIDISGGWHASCDYNRNPLLISYGMLGLSQLGLLKPVWGDAVADELRWGSQYFQKLVRPDGGVMQGTGDHRFDVTDNALVAMYTTLFGLAMSAQFFKETDAAYSDQCLAKAVSIWNYIAKPSREFESYKFQGGTHPAQALVFGRNYHGSSVDIGDRLFAATLLYDGTRDKRFLEEAAGCASQLADLQVGGNVRENPAAGCFYDFATNKEFASRHVYEMYWGPLGLCAAAEQMPEHPERARWLATLERVADQYALMSQRNPWGLIPLFWFSSPHPGAHPAGSAFYRYFYLEDGLNLGLLRAAVFLVRAHKLLAKPEYLVTAARQIDWVLGGNPQQTSFVEGVGMNQPQYVMSEPDMPMPKVPGGVMTGFLGLPEEDAPSIYATSVEYDMPPTGMLMWLLCDWKKQFGCVQPVKKHFGKPAKQEPCGTFRKSKVASLLPDQWQVIAPVSRTFTLEKSLLTSLPTHIDTGAGTISLRPAQAAEGYLDLEPFGRAGADTCAYVFIPFSMDEDRGLIFAFGADYCFEAFLDGQPLLDTLTTGNISVDYDHVKAVRLSKGRHLLAVRVLAGSGGFQLYAGLFADPDTSASGNDAESPHA